MEHADEVIDVRVNDRLYDGSMKALLRLNEGSLKALLRADAFSMEHADELIDLRVNDRLANERQRAVPDGVGFMQPLWYHACEAACVSIRQHTSAYVSIRR